MRALLFLVLLGACKPSQESPRALPEDRSEEFTWYKEVTAEVWRRTAARRASLEAMGFAPGEAERVERCPGMRERQAAVECLHGRAPDGSSLHKKDKNGEVIGLTVPVGECLDMWMKNRRTDHEECNFSN